jgi:hypothetical protein
MPGPNPGLLFDFPLSANQIKKEEVEDDSAKISKPTLFDLFRPLAITKRTLNMFLQWFSVTMVYYGLSFASTR